jgi:hypothetical protein
MKLPGKNPGYGNRGKTNLVFPPFPQPLLLTINLDQKRAEPKITDDRLHKIFDATPNGGLAPKSPLYMICSVPTSVRNMLAFRVLRHIIDSTANNSIIAGV